MIKELIKVFFRFIKWVLFFIFLIVVLLISGVVYTFFNPEWLLKETTVRYALEQTQILNSWQWKKLELSHEYLKWNERNFRADIEDFCFEYKNIDIDAKSCLSLNLAINASWTFSSGLNVVAIKPIILSSPSVAIGLSNQPKEDEGPVDYLAYWNLFWSNAIPDFEVKLEELKVTKEKELFRASVDVVKTAKTLNLQTMGFKLFATQDNIVITAPKRIEIPYDLKTKNPLFFDQIKIEAKILANEIPVTASAKIDTAVLLIHTNIHKKWLRQDLGSLDFIKDVATKSKASLKVSKLKQTVFRLLKAPFNELPAPLNEMEGDLELRLRTEDIVNTKSINLFLDSELDLGSPNQDLHLIVKSNMPMSLEDYSFGLINLDLDFRKIKLILPRLSKTSLPPQLVPDSRFKNSQAIVKENHNQQVKPSNLKERSKNEVEIDLHIQAVGNNFVQFNSNLIDEPVRFNLDLDIKKNAISKGFVKVHPLKTVVFKRQIYLANLQVDFVSNIEPNIASVIEFHLPEYKIFLDLEGPISSPRHVFRSEPPLPQDDILGVLLFGRPLSGLDNDDKGVAGQTGKILQEGILNLAVLYYFAGTPIESIGYDAENSQVSAQLGLGSKSSLRIGGGAGGLNSAGVRRSLGKGWYLDSSVQRTVNDNGTASGNYGVLLERIIAY